MIGMQGTTQIAARRSWLDAERRALPLAPPSPGPTYAQTFMTGFLRGSMLQMAVCAPPRQAAARPVDAVFIARIGDNVDARATTTPDTRPVAC
jgi:hypothetical protein